jgi:creatinine amidohydrolase
MTDRRPYILSENTWKTVRETEYEVAVLPWGATEAHNYHLPYGTDTLHSERVAAGAAAVAWEAGAKVIVLPAVPFGVHSGQLDIPFCLHVAPTTQLALLSDLAVSLAEHGIRKLVIVNGHGGNEFRALIRELQPSVDIFMCALDWYAYLDSAPFFDEPGDHAGELETSVLMHIAPDLVLPLAEAGAGMERRFRIAALRERRVWAPRRWSSVSDDTGVGNPERATAAKGEAFYRATTEAIGGFLIELAAADTQDMYQSNGEAQASPVA